MTVRAPQGQRLGVQSLRPAVILLVHGDPAQGLDRQAATAARSPSARMMARLSAYHEAAAG